MSPEGQEGWSPSFPSRIALGDGGLVAVTTAAIGAAGPVTVLHVQGRADAEVTLAPVELAAVVRELASRLPRPARAQLLDLLHAIEDRT
jgi:hypothetical protein